MARGHVWHVGHVIYQTPYLCVSETRYGFIAAEHSKTAFLIDFHLSLRFKLAGGLGSGLLESRQIEKPYIKIKLEGI